MMRMRNIELAFLCDGNETVGYGHFFRCFYLAKHFHLLGQKIVFSGDFSAFARERLERVSISWIQRNSYLPAEIPTACDAIIVDSYQVEQTFINALTGSGKVIMLIDDFCKYDYARVDVLLNISIGAGRFAYNAKQVLIGPEYMPFDSAFDAVRERKQVTAIRKVGVFLGGHDTHHLGAILVGLTDEYLKMESGVFISTTQVLPQGLRGLWTKMSPTHDVAGFLEEIDLIVCGGGLIKYEAAYCGVPSICIHPTRGHEEETQCLEKVGLTLNAGVGDVFDRCIFEALLDRVREKDYLSTFRDRSKQYLKTGSGRIVAEIIISLVNGRM